MLSIFYNEIIKEASTGSVDADITYNILFNTIIPEENINITSNIKLDNVLVPTLVIKNKKLFDELLSAYLDLALNFYNDNNYYIETTENTFYYYKVKTILSILWSNATYEDFNDPINFLRKRISFFKNNLEEYNTLTDLGYSNILNSNIKVKNTKSNLRNETPYKLEIVLDNNDSIYELPNIYYGICNNDLYIYAIQNRKNVNIENNSFQKFIKRKLYSINDGLDIKNETFENYDIGNLKDVTPSFLLALNIIIGIFKGRDIENVIVPFIMYIRWNDKEIMFDKKERKIEGFDKLSEQTKHEYIQSNLTEKLIRTFLRLSYHSDGIEIENYPFELDSSLKLKIGDIKSFNNELLDETYHISKGQSKNQLL